LVATAILVAAALLPGATRARPRDLDQSLARVTDHGIFHVQLKSGLEPIRISRIHQWTVHVSGADGAPVTGAHIDVDGGMPEHGHGLPTAPRATAAGGPGDYVIDGMKFSMTGWWVLKLDIKAADGRADNITFNVVL
jgi:hypothetical protein